MSSETSQTAVNALDSFQINLKIACDYLQYHVTLDEHNRVQKIYVSGQRHVKASFIGKTKAELESVCGISDGAVENRSCRIHLEYRTGHARERFHIPGASLNKSGEPPQQKRSCSYLLQVTVGQQGACFRFRALLYCVYEIQYKTKASNKQRRPIWLYILHYLFIQQSRGWTHDQSWQKEMISRGTHNHCVQQVSKL
jgi:hypothetical protein